MNVSRGDVVNAYRLLLGRTPESENVVRLHLEHAGDLRTLVTNILSSGEATKYLARPEPDHPHHVFKGYSNEDLRSILEFRKFEGPGAPDFVTNFLGCRYRTLFSTALLPYDGTVEGYPIPVSGYQGETAEFVGALRSVLEARPGRYRMLECGAGYGTWMAICRAAALQKQISDIHVYGVEGDEGHFSFLQQHMADNAISPSEFTAYKGAVGMVGLRSMASGC